MTWKVSRVLAVLLALYQSSGEMTNTRFLAATPQEEVAVVKEMPISNISAAGNAQDIDCHRSGVFAGGGGVSGDCHDPFNILKCVDKGGECNYLDAVQCTTSFAKAYVSARERITDFFPRLPFAIFQIFIAPAIGGSSKTGQAWELGGVPIQKGFLSAFYPGKSC